ncbi:hypothetical protein [Streptomyces sp. NPDC001970]
MPARRPLEQRQYFAKVDLTPQEVVPVTKGTSPPTPPLLANKARPARATMEAASLAASLAVRRP